MSQHYNAFISYRHHPEDIRVASELHRRLEHYPIPASLRRQGKKALRLFRDKDELPTTSNLSDDICRALENSDYLVVICSPHTRESMWVGREISYFLEHHSRSRVLTVLVRGEPGEIIPEVLLSEERVNPATGETEQIPLEPLSCDWRLPGKQARREELPRLAAAMLECSYAELRQRERHYRMQKRMAAVSAALAVSLGFLGYAAYSNGRLQAANDQVTSANNRLQQANAEVEANLQQALRNQSVYLAGESQRLLESGDRMSALCLALEALPDREGDRPYVPRAMEALANAVYAYEPAEQIAVEGVYRADGIVREFAVTDDRTVVYMLDNSDTVTCWDADQYRQLGAVHVEKPYGYFAVTPAGNLVVRQSESVCCINSRGELLWEKEEHLNLAQVEESGLLLAAADEVLSFLDPDTGEELREPVTLDTEENLLFVQTAYRTENAIVMRNIASGDEPSRAILVDPATGGCTVLAEDLQYFEFAETDRDGNVVLLGQFGREGDDAGRWGQFLQTSPADIRIRSYDRQSHALRWEQTMVQHTPGVLLQLIPDSNHLAVRLGTSFAALDAETGAILNTAQTISDPVYADVGEAYMQIVTENGYAGQFRYGEDGIAMTPTTLPNLQQALFEHGLFVLEQNSQQVLRYQLVSDSDWLPLTKQPVEWIKEYAAGRTRLALQDGETLRVYDTETQQLLLQEKVDYNTTFAGFSMDETEFWILKDDQFCGLSLTGGQEKCVPLPEEWRTQYRKAFAYENMVYVPVEHRESDAVGLCGLEMQTGRLQTWPVCEEVQDGWQNEELQLLTAGQGYALLWGETFGRVYELSMETGEVRILAEGVTQMPYAGALGDGTAALSAAGQLQRRAWGGEALFTISEPAEKSVSFTLLDGELLTLCYDGKLRRYDDAGSLLGSCTPRLYDTFFNDIDWRYGTEKPSHITWQKSADNRLLLNAFRICSIIELENWETEGFVEHCLGYVPQTDRFLAEAYSNESHNTSVVLYDRRTLPQLRAMAEETLNGFALSEEQQLAYGLTEGEE